MISFSRLSAVFAAGFLLFSGCASIEIKSEGSMDRVLTGTVNYSADDALPPGTILTVRLLDTSDASVPPMVVGEQTITNPGASPVAFRIEYRANDVLLRHGLNIDARISVGGRLRFYNVTSYAVTFQNAGDPHTVWVNPAGK